MKDKTRFFTDRQVAALKPIEGQTRTDYYHASESGFICRVSEKSKTWMVSHVVKKDGQARRRKAVLGLYPDLSLALALEKAQEIKSDARSKGSDIVASRQAQKTAATIQDVMDLYFKETPLAAKGMANSIRMSEKDIIPALGKMKAMDLRRIDVKRLHTSIVERGAEVTANRTVELLRRAYNCAHEEELIDINPFPALKKIKAPEASRERILTDTEIKTLWDAMDQTIERKLVRNKKKYTYQARIISEAMRDILRLLLLTGQRTTDVMTIQVGHIDKDRKEWTVPAPPRGKNRNPNVLPLSPLAWEILEPRLDNEQWVFPSKYNSTRVHSKNTGHIHSTKDARRRLREETGIEGWTGHDFRRTCRTIMSREKVKPHIAERVLGHVQGGVEGIYDRYAYLQEKAEALQKIDKAIRKIIGLDQNNVKVVKLRIAAE